MLIKCIHSAVLIKPPQNISQLYKKKCVNMSTAEVDNIIMKALTWYNSHVLKSYHLYTLLIKNTVLSFAIVCWIFNRFIQLYWEVCLTILILNRKLLPSLSLSLCGGAILIVHGFYLYNVIVFYRNRYCLQEKNWSTLYHI